MKEPVYIIMVVADVLVPNRHQAINNHNDNFIMTSGIWNIHSLNNHNLRLHDYMKIFGSQDYLPSDKKK